MSSKTAAAISLALASTFSYANSDPNLYQIENLEKCQVIKNGTGLIKAHKSDCKAIHGKSSCASQNAAGDTEAWIFVPKGQCEKINAGDCSGISNETKSRLEDGACKF